MNYLGLDVLAAESNTREPIQDAMPRLLSCFDPEIGKPNIVARDRAPKMTRTYLWTCRDRAEIQALRDWLGIRRGRAVPFWTPTWRRDLRLVLPVAAADDGITIENHGYGAMQFGNTSARHHICLVSNFGALTIRRVTACSSQGAQERLTLDSQVGAAFPASSLVCFLLYCRLDTDAPQIVYHTDSIAECSLPYVEIPEECP